MNRFKYLRRIEAYHLISNSEFNCSLTTYRNTLKELYIHGSYEYNFFKVFTGIKLPNLEILSIKKMKRDILELDIKALAEAAFNAKHLDFTETPSISPDLLTPMLESLGHSLQTLILLQRDNITDTVFYALERHVK